MMVRVSRLLPFTVRGLMNNSGYLVVGEVLATSFWTQPPGAQTAGQPRRWNIERLSVLSPVGGRAAHRNEWATDGRA